MMRGSVLNILQVFLFCLSRSVSGYFFSFEQVVVYRFHFLRVRVACFLDLQLYLFLGHERALVGQMRLLRRMPHWRQWLQIALL